MGALSETTFLEPGGWVLAKSERGIPPYPGRRRHVEFPAAGDLVSFTPDAQGHVDERLTGDARSDDADLHGRRRGPAELRQPTPARNK